MSADVNWQIANPPCRYTRIEAVRLAIARYHGTARNHTPGADRDTRQNQDVRTQPTTTTDGYRLSVPPPGPMDCRTHIVMKGDQHRAGPDRDIIRNVD